jgi:ribosome biogenesis GTPase
MDTILTLQQLGWRPFFQQQLSLEEYEDTVFARVKEHHRSGFILASEQGDISLPASSSTVGFTVGDWILLDKSFSFIRALERLSVFSRKAAGSKVEQQLIASNVDTVFIVSSLNDDFNLSRIERFLALANEAQVETVIVLSKADLCSDPFSYIEQIHAIDSSLIVETVNSLDHDSVDVLLSWCGTGKTIAFLGSSGVGKSTLVNTLLGEQAQQTAAIREDDSKGKHTTTGRSMHIMPSGGILLDTPGMRELQLAACADGVAETFSDISKLAKQCRFSDCSHNDEPKCAVQKAISAAELDPRRLMNYQKLMREQARNSASLSEKRATSKAFQKHINTVQKESRSRKKN